MDSNTFGKAAYDGYCESTGGKSLVSGATLPPWEALNDTIRVAWMSAAEAVVEKTDRDKLWDLLHEAAGWINSYSLGTGDRLYERIQDALDGE